ncbi:PAAR domain-containing protein [Massilia sp. S19_KUP03_FR1]|uniref:PAAR domain-containing protein n=1 Tax=Massilia sp. S19_KUP03_FR1 TaxID=3025503 RepID=UPI002FCDC552
MSEALILLGDATDHGGTVTSAAPVATAGGKPIARLGDMVACPRCRGNFPIVQGNPAMTFDGAAAAYHGCAVACGAKLIASQSEMTTEPAGGAGDTTPRRYFSFDEGIAAAVVSGPYRGRFQLLDEQTDQPISGRRVRVRTSGGASIEAVTDSQGYTPWVEREVAESLAFELIDDRAP